MARSLILTGWAGDTYGAMAVYTVPLMRRYAIRHGHDFSAVDLSGQRPASWQKLPAIEAGLTLYDVVVWLDVDVVILRSDRDIVAEMEPGSCQGLVEHLTECGRVPNCGVWVVTRDIRPTLEQAWVDGSDFVLHPWWEQAAIMRLMGYSIGPGPHGTLDTPTKLYGRTTFLPPRWNHHPADANSPAQPDFVHVTQYPDRIGTIRRLVNAPSP